MKEFDVDVCIVKNGFIKKIYANYGNRISKRRTIKPYYRNFGIRLVKFKK